MQQQGRGTAVMSLYRPMTITGKGKRESVVITTRASCPICGHARFGMDARGRVACTACRAVVKNPVTLSTSTDQDQE